MKILNKKTLADCQGTKITLFEVYSPIISKKTKPGQFAVVMVSEKGERIPLTIVDTDAKKQSITIIVQELGFSTRLLGKMNRGESLYALVGPMGHATEIKNYGTVVIVGGGVGIAEVYPVAKALKKAGNKVSSILGARTKGLLILESEMKAVSDEVHIVTDDGSYSKKGFVTDILKELLTYHLPLTTYHLIYAVGPIPMMKAVSNVTKEFGVKTIVSLNALMVDATGMCGGCRVKIGNDVKFSCVDGPEFDAHLVDWKELEARTKAYLAQEKHICKLSL